MKKMPAVPMRGMRIATLCLVLFVAASCCRSSLPSLDDACPAGPNPIRVITGNPHSWPESIDADSAGNLYFSDHCENTLYRLARSPDPGKEGPFREETLIQGLDHVSGVSIDRDAGVLYCGTQVPGDGGFSISRLKLTDLDGAALPLRMDDEEERAANDSIVRRIGKGKIEKPNGVVFDTGEKVLYYTSTQYRPFKNGHVRRIAPDTEAEPAPIRELNTPNGIDICRNGETTGGFLLVTQTGLPELTNGGGISLGTPGPDRGAETVLPGLSPYHPDGVFCMKGGDALVAGFWSGTILYLRHKKEPDGYHEAVPVPLCRNLGHPTDLVMAKSSSGTGQSLYVTTTDLWRLVLPQNMRGGRVLEIPDIERRLAGLSRPIADTVQKASPPDPSAAAERAENRRAIEAFRELRRGLGRKDPVFSREGLSGPLLFAHRGGVMETAESTVRGFRYALDAAGADVLELDVQITRDGRFVVWHGPGLDNVRIEGENLDPKNRPRDRRRIHDFKWRDLDGRAWVADPCTVDLATVPEEEDRLLLPLDAFLRRFPSVPLNIEMKATFKMALGGRAGLAENVAAFRRILMEDGSPRTVVVAGADLEILDAFRRIDGDRFPTNLSPWEQIKLKFSRPSLEHRVLETSTAKFMSGAGIVEKVRGLHGATYVFITGFGPIRSLDRCLEDEPIFEILDRGVDGIMTDRPRAVREVMHRWLQKEETRRRKGGSP